MRASCIPDAIFSKGTRIVSDHHILWNPSDSEFATGTFCVGPQKSQGTPKILEMKVPGPRGKNLREKPVYMSYTNIN